MGFFDSIKNIMSIPEEDDYDEEIEDVEEESRQSAASLFNMSSPQRHSAVSRHPE